MKAWMPRSSTVEELPDDGEQRRQDAAD